MLGSIRFRCDRSRYLQRWSTLLALGALALVASAPPAAATCDEQYTTRIGPPAMVQPDGNIQTISRDCTGIAGCSDYFDITLEAGDDLYLSLCSNGGSVDFDADIAIRSGFDFGAAEECVTDGCGTATEITFFASDAGTYRIRIGQEGALSLPSPDGNYTLAYSAPAGRMIVPSSCGDGTLDAGEQCDDGNDIDGDCCSRSCAYESNGAACFDEGNDCTDDTCDGAGVCTHTDSVVGQDCLDEGNACTDDVCDGAGTCLHPNSPVGQYCDDGTGSFCTSDTCDGAGTCTHVDVPGCNMLPTCAVPQPRVPVTFPHPKKAPKMDVAFVQAFVGCNIAGGNTPNATTETGTVPSCAPAETPDEQDGSPPSGWHWGPYSSGRVYLYARCPGAGDLGLKMRFVGLTDANGVPLNADGTFLLSVRLTLTDPAGAMTTVDFPLSFDFHVINGVAKVITSLNAMLLDHMLPPLPNGTSIEFGPVDPYSGGVFEVRDSNGNAFARPGVFLE